MQNSRDKFTFNRIVFEAVKHLALEDQSQVYNAIFEYCLNFNEVELSGAPKAIFSIIKPDLDKSNKQYVNGSKNKSGLQLASKKTKPTRSQPEANRKPIFNKATFKKTLIDLGASEVHVNDWLVTRDKKKAVYTQTALSTFLNECNKNNFIVADAVRYCAENNWSGFKVKWVSNLENNQNEKSNSQTNKQIFESAMESEAAKNFRFEP